MHLHQRKERRFLGSLAILALLMAWCVPSAMVSAQNFAAEPEQPLRSPAETLRLKEAKNTKNAVRRLRSAPNPFSREIPRHQMILVKDFQTADTQVLGTQWASEEHKNRHTKYVADKLKQQIINRLRRLGSDASSYEDAAANGSAELGNATIVAGSIEMTGLGVDHPLAGVHIKVYPAQNSGSPYGNFSDGGMVGQISTRCVGRITKSSSP